MRSFLITTTLTCVARAISLWDPSGPYHVGYTQHVFNHTTPNDPTEPGTFMLTTIYYPTRQIPEDDVPYIDPILAKFYENTTGLAQGSLSKLTSRLQFQAPLLSGPGFGNGSSPYPTLVFTPGAGLSCSAYTAYLSELASYGFAILAIDHPGEAPYLPLPFTNGTEGVYGWPDFSSYPPTMEETFAVIDFRVSDILAAVSEPFFPSLVRQYGASFNLTHFGLFGHSAGGCAAEGVLSSKAPGLERFKVGVNIDGTYIQFLKPNATATDLKVPFLEIASEQHFGGIPPSDDEETSDYTWKRFSDAQSGWLRNVQVNGSMHIDFSDIPLWIDRLDQRESLNYSRLGTISGARATQLTSALLNEVFGVLQGTGLDGVDEWVGKAPELFLLEEKTPSY